MTSINITPEVMKLMEQSKKNGIRESASCLETLKKGKLQVFQEAQTSVFWIEGDKPKWARAHIVQRLTTVRKMIYRDAEPKKKTPIKKIVEKILPSKEEDTHLASPLDLRSFAKKYMNNYKLDKKFKKEHLTPEEQHELIDEVSEAFTEGTKRFVRQEIYGGEKAYYRNKTRMDEEDRELYNQQSKDEFNFYLENLIWLATPSEDYLKKNSSQKSYGEVTLKLRSCVVNSYVVNRTVAIL